VLIMALPLVSGFECGSNLTDGCIVSNVTNITVFPKKVLNFPSGITVLQNARLDCNGSTISGLNRGSGIRLPYFNNTLVNCTVQKFEIGINASGFFDDPPCFVEDRFVYHSKFIIANNTLRNNTYGLVLQGSSQCFDQQNNSITSNAFLNNRKEGIVFEIAVGNSISGNSFSYNSVGNTSIALKLKGSSKDNGIWGNTFNHTGIAYETTASNQYCVGGIANDYRLGAEGPNCSCLPLVSGLSITNNFTPCRKSYSLPWGVNIQTSNISFDCAGAEIRDGLDWGILLIDVSGVEIKNCRIANSSTGIYFESYPCNGMRKNTIKYSTIEKNAYGIAFWENNWCSDKIRDTQIIGNNINNNSVAGIYLLSTDNTTFSGNTIVNNGRGLKFQNTKFFSISGATKSHAYSNEIVNNTINAENLQNATVDMELNWWGTREKSIINAGIFDCNDSSVACIDFDPWLNQSPSDAQLDLEINGSSILFSGSQGGITSSFTIRNNGPFPAKDVEATILVTDSSALLLQKKIAIGTMEPLESLNISSPIPGERGETIIIIIDPANKVNDPQRGNNKAERKFMGLVKYFVAVDVPPDAANAEIENFIRSRLADGDFVSSKDDAEIIISVARHNPLIVWHFDSLEQDGWGFFGGGIKFQDKFCDKPYCGVVGSRIVDGRREIAIEANDVEGFVAAAKEFAAAQEQLKHADGALFAGEDSLNAIAVFDFMHSSKNNINFKKNTSEFAGIVRKALDDVMLTEEQVNATVDGINLRLLRLRPGYSDAFNSFKDESQLPVVLARGLWSNLYSWRDFGIELASKEAKDTWLIEITGGPDTDCTDKEVDDCPDYTYDNLTDRFVPALLNKVLASANKSQLKYVGFSNGCRSALSSMEKGKFNASKVNTFVAVGCPGNFSGESYFSGIIGKSGEIASDRLRNKNITHITFSELSGELKSITGKIVSLFTIKEKEKISTNLFDYYFNIINSPSDKQPGQNLWFNNFELIYGDVPFTKNNDLLIPAIDQEAIFSQINSTNKKILKTNYPHFKAIVDSLPDQSSVKEEISSFID
ncbi:right-handed parallel beta-helix repeat-containing protein, partial [Candidatus Woesearchaeota archaeon]|nr:right-handed parallel beta-helix repeat-containing protein [Candidatus Woesearchaeota archaeon]